MPVTINGDGSITGLSVGGLPDGSVDSGTLASSAVTTAKIATNATYACAHYIYRVASGSNATISTTAGNGTKLLMSVKFCNFRIFVLPNLAKFRPSRTIWRFPNSLL